MENVYVDGYVNAPQKREQDILKQTENFQKVANISCHFLGKNKEEK